MVNVKNVAAMAIGLSALIDTAAAHPGEHLSTLQVKRQAEHAQALAARAASKLARCADSERAVAMRERGAVRRAAKATALRRRALKRSSSQTQEYDTAGHNETGIIDQSEAFTVNTSCILEPQATIGPYWVEGELIRQDLTDGESGVPMQLELEFVDVNTCEPVSGLYVDIWNANATGYYSGIAESGLDTTFLRGIQITDDDGVATFDTLVAGHYSGRAVHTHLMIHENVTVYDNSTYTGGTVRSISQLFYDTVLQSAVEATDPYSTNKAAITSNEDDSILSAITDESYDPFLKYIYLGSSISDGVFAFHSIGIDTSADYTSNESAAAHYYETGGVASSNSGMGGGSGSPPFGNNTGNSTGGPGGAAPSGAIPSGVVLSAASGIAPSGSIQSIASTTVANADNAVSVTAASSTSTSTSSSGAGSTRGGLLKSLGFFTKTAQRPTDLPSILPSDPTEHGAQASDQAHGHNTRSNNIAPTVVASLGAEAHGHPNGEASQTSNAKYSHSVLSAGPAPSDGPLASDETKSHHSGHLSGAVQSNAP